MLTPMFSYTTDVIGCWLTPPCAIGTNVVTGTGTRSPKRAVILLSGVGSIAGALIHAQRDPVFGLDVVSVGSDTEAAAENWHFVGPFRKMTFASRNQHRIYWGPLKAPIEWSLKTVLAPWAYMASVIYHDSYWYPVNAQGATEIGTVGVAVLPDQVGTCGQLRTTRSRLRMGRGGDKQQKRQARNRLVH